MEENPSLLLVGYPQPSKGCETDCSFLSLFSLSFIFFFLLEVLAPNFLNVFQAGKHVMTHLHL